MKTRTAIIVILVLFWICFAICLVCYWQGYAHGKNVGFLEGMDFALREVEIATKIDPVKQISTYKLRTYQPVGFSSYTNFATVIKGRIDETSKWMLYFDYKMGRSRR